MTNAEHARKIVMDLESALQHAKAVAKQSVVPSKLVLLEDSPDYAKYVVILPPKLNPPNEIRVDVEYTRDGYDPKRCHLCLRFARPELNYGSCSYCSIEHRDKHFKSWDDNPEMMGR